MKRSQPPRKPAPRFDIRKNDTDALWTVYDTVSGLPAVANGVPITRCELEEARDIARLLNTRLAGQQEGTEN